MSSVLWITEDAVVFSYSRAVISGVLFTDVDRLEKYQLIRIKLPDGESTHESQRVRKRPYNYLSK